MKKYNIIVLLMLMVFASIIGIKEVRADDDKLWCYYKTDDTMIRVSIKKEITWKDYKKEKLGQQPSRAVAVGYIDVAYGNINANDTEGTVANYVAGGDVYSSLKTNGRPIFTIDSYLSNYFNVTDKKTYPIQAHCPEAIVYLEDSMGSKYLAYDLETDLESQIQSQLEEHKSAIQYQGFIGKNDEYVYIGNKVEQEDYWAIYNQILSEYAGETIPLLGCDIVDADVKKFIKEIFTIISILVPIAIIGLSTYELAKAMAGSKEDEMKKAQKRLVIRLFVSILIFIVPTIVNVLFNVAQDLWEKSDYYTCDLNGESIGTVAPQKACYACGTSTHGVYHWGYELTYQNRSDCMRTDYTEEECPTPQNRKACYMCGNSRYGVFHWGSEATYGSRRDCGITSYSEEECKEKINNS